MANIGVLSPWMSADEDFQLFLNLAKRGDLIEVQRQGYCHWAVYVGEIPVDETGDGTGSLKPMVVHRANPEVRESDSLGFSASISSSSSSSGGTFGGGTVIMESLEDVWRKDQARINNTFDSKRRPFDQEEIMERVMGVVTQRAGMAYRCYNVLTNNCEHFATWARNGWGVSQQVEEGITNVISYGTMFAVGMVSRPLALVAGMGMVGYQAMQPVSTLTAQTEVRLEIRLEFLDLNHQLMDIDELGAIRVRGEFRHGHDLVETVIVLDELSQCLL